MDERITEIANHYGLENQLEMFVEECAEAIQSAQKCKRSTFGQAEKQNLRMEVADVLIMAEQMRYLLDSDVVDAMISYKLNRQLDRMRKEGNNG